MKHRKQILCGFLALALSLGAVPLSVISYAGTVEVYQNGSQKRQPKQNDQTNRITANAPNGYRGPMDRPPMEGQGEPEQDIHSAQIVNTGEEYTFDETIYPYRAMLSSSEQAVYNQIYANAVAVNASFFLATGVDVNSLSDAICAVYNDHPELFWLDTAYSYRYLEDGTISTVTLSFNDTVNNLSAARSAFDSAVASIVSGASAYGSNVEKELYVHDAISSRVTYNLAAPLNQSAYSALVLGQSVCAGYSRAFQYVMQQLGFTVYYCTGTSDGEAHAWNLVLIDGNFYNVDLSWNDTISEASGSRVYPYFNRTDSAFAADHTRTGLSLNLPVCTSTAMSYESISSGTLPGSGSQNAPGGQAVAAPVITAPVRDLR